MCGSNVLISQECRSKESMDQGPQGNPISYFQEQNLEVKCAFLKTEIVVNDEWLQ